MRPSVLSACISTVGLAKPIKFLTLTHVKSEIKIITNDKKSRFETDDNAITCEAARSLRAMTGVAAARLGVALAQRCAAPAAAHAAATTQLPRRSRAWVSRGAAAAHVATGGSAASAAAVPPAHDSLPLPDPLGLLMSRVTPGDDVTVSGWVRHVRRQKRVAFATVSDGSAGGTLQVRRLDRDVVLSHDVLELELALALPFTHATMPSGTATCSWQACCGLATSFSFVAPT